MFEHDHRRQARQSVAKPGQKFPDWLKGFARFLYLEKGLQRMQVQGTLFVVTGYDVSKHTLKGWLYSDGGRPDGA